MSTQGSGGNVLAAIYIVVGFVLVPIVYIWSIINAARYQGN